MKELLLFVVLLFIAGCSAPKEPAAAEIREVDSLLELSNQHNRTIDPETSLRYSLEALEPAKSVDYRRGMARAYCLIGNALYNTGNYDKSMEYISLGEEYADGDVQMLSEFIRVRARIYAYLGLHEKAKSEFLKGLSYIKQIKKHDDRKFLTALAYENLGHLYAMTNHPDSSLLYIQKNMEMLNTMDEAFVYSILINSFTTIGEFYTKEQKYDSAGIYFDKSIQLADKYDYPYLSRTSTYQGEMYVQKNEIDSALCYYFKALDNLEKTGLKGEYPGLYGKISNAYSSLGDATAAREYENKKLLLEGQLNEEKLKSAKKVLTLLTNVEKQRERKRAKLFVILGVSISFLLAAIASVWFLAKQNKAKYTRGKEQEMEILKVRMNESLAEIIELAKKNDPTFMIRFQQVYPGFTPALQAVNPKMQLSELHLCTLIYLQFTTKEIADCMCRSVRTIQNRKNSLRKKLGIVSDIDINVWLHDLFVKSSI